MDYEGTKAQSAAPRELGALPGLLRWAAGLAIGLAALMLSQDRARADYSTTVDPSSTWGTWDGWGTSLCWWANVFGTRDDLANIVFTLNYTPLNGQTLPGLGMNIARYNVGGCSSNAIKGDTMQVSPNIPAFKQIQGYWLDWFSSDSASSSWNWSADANQRTMLLKAKARGANLFELFSNSPMWWMCYNHNPSGADNGANDNLQSWNYQSHAVYLATVAKYASTNWGITFTSVEPFNEPIAPWWKSTGTQEGCHFDTGTQASVISYLRSELNNRSLANTVVAASDESFYDQATSTWNSFGTTTKFQVGRVNVHGYQYSGGRRDLLSNAVAGKKLWNSEYGEGDGTGVQLAANLNLDFRWLHMTGWCYWQAFDSGGWGLIQSNPGDNWIGTANPKYYVLAQYARHIRPGMKILDGGEGNTIAAYDAVAHKLVLVTMNYGTAQWISYDLSRFYNAAGPIRRWMTAAASSGVKYAQYSDTVLSGRTFRSYFATNTIQTFEVSNVYIDPSPPPVPVGLAATAGVEQVILSWTASSGATGYNLKRGTAPGGPYSSLGSVTATSFSDTAVAKETTYYYVLSAISAGGESANSAEISVTPHAPPQLWVILPTGGNQVTLSWAGWATGYTPYVASNLTAPVVWQPVTNVPQSSNGMLFLFLPTTNGTGRFFRLETP